MNTHNLIDIPARIQRLERQNRFLIMLLCSMFGIALIAASRQASAVINATEIRTERFTLVDDQGKSLVDTRGVKGVEIRAYLPHNVVQQ